MIKLDCNSVLWAFGIKLTFFNLCGDQTTVHSVDASSLPAPLPAGSTFVRGLKLDILTNGQIIQDLPDGTGIDMDFPLSNQLPDHSAVLYWNGSQWVEISQHLNKDQISQTLGISAPDELYQLIQNITQVFYETLTTDKTGIFVLVQK